LFIHFLGEAKERMSDEMELSLVTSAERSITRACSRLAQGLTTTEHNKGTGLLYLGWLS